MKLVLIILAMATNASAFEQIFADNSGGNSHVDSDGITYKQSERAGSWAGEPDIENFPKSDSNIYYDFTSMDNGPIGYDIPINSDGYFVLIVKLRRQFTMNLILNYHIQLLPNVNTFDMCRKIEQYSPCDLFFYFCVTDGLLYYQNQTSGSSLQNKNIHIEFSPLNNDTWIAGLVVLKGKIFERQTLKSSITKEALFFDPAKMNPKCGTNGILKEWNDLQNSKEEQRDKILRNRTEVLCEQVSKFQTDVGSSVKRVYQTSNQISMRQNQLIEQMNNKFEKLQLELTTNSNKNVEVLQADMDIKFNQTNTNIEALAAKVQQSSIQQMHIHNQSAERMDFQLEKLQLELASKTNQTNKNFEMLQIIMQYLVDDSRKMRAEIKQIHEKMTLEQISFRSEILKMSNQINDIREIVLTNEESAK
jgi:translation elongation factor EF-1beta